MSAFALDLTGTGKLARVERSEVERAIRFAADSRVQSDSYMREFGNDTDREYMKAILVGCARLILQPAAMPARLDAAPDIISLALVISDKIPPGTIEFRRPDGSLAGQIANLRTEVEK